MKSCIAFNLCLAIVAIYLADLPTSTEAQITFSRDWLAGSGKRSKPVDSRYRATKKQSADLSKISFSREWLASGKRSADSDAWICVPKIAVAKFFHYVLEHDQKESLTYKALSDEQ